MAWDDRPSSRDSGPSTNPLRWLVSGSVPFFSVPGVRVRAHASLLIFVGIVLLLAWPTIFPLQIRILSMAIWTAVVILHEFGHCLVARRLGGRADEVLLWPLGGLTSAETPQRASAIFYTAAAGPAVNLLLCIASATGVYLLTPTPEMRSLSVRAGHAFVSLNPFRAPMADFHGRWSDPALYCWWVFFASYRLFLLNLLPIFPLDGGQMLQAVLWSVVGQFRSMVVAANTGMAAAVAVGLSGLAFQSWLLAAFMVFCFYESYRRRLLLRENGPDDWRESFEFAGSLFAPTEQPRRRRLSARAIHKARKIAQQEKAARDRIDAILAKVSAHGMASLTWSERRTLRKTTEQHRRRELEFSRFQ